MIRAFREWFLDQLAMYAAYHRDRRNQVTHYLGVPVIVFSILIVIDQLRIGADLSAAMLLLAVVAASYVVAVPVVGFTFLTICVPLYVGAGIVADMPPDQRWAIAAGSFVAGWIVQFIGHVFEGRRPAFTVNVLQIFMAPAFLVAELLFAVGLERSLSQVLRARAQKYAV